MAQTSKTFRIFVSSTFSDLKAERNALQKHVFPKLRELCIQHGCRFQAIDLRWGVSEEASRDQQTVKICLEEIKRCQRMTPRPNFIVLLGDRYGWRPPPAEIPADEFDLILQRVTNPGDRALLVWDDQQPDESKGWYRRDDNAVSAVYCLQPRTGEFVDYARWELVERRLHSLLLHAAGGTALPPGEQVKYSASATEREIVLGALNVNNANEHVFCFFRNITNLDDLMNDSALSKRAGNFLDVDESEPPAITPDRDAHALLDDLKEHLRGSLPNNFRDYQAEWRRDGITIGHIGTLPATLEDCLSLIEDDNAPSNLCVDVWRRLARIILDEVKKIESIDALDKEVEDHEGFGRDRARFFTGRKRYLDAIGDYVEQSDPHLVALWGESGSGKSALVAAAAQRVRSEHPDTGVIVRFIGATPASSDGRALLESLCRQISLDYGVTDAIPAAYRELALEFPKRLALATAERPLILFLDGLDQLSSAEHARNLIWLPASLPEHVRLIVSTIPGECLSALERKLAGASLLKLEPMPKDEGEALLDLWLKDAHRTLQPEQRAEVLSKFAECSLPLYLKLAFEEARLWHSYDGASQLGPGIAGIIVTLFGRLSEEANHGEVMVSRSLGYLAAGKNGLTEDELLDVLSSDERVMSEFKRRSPKSPAVDQLPVVVWSRLYFDLEPYLTERSADGASLFAFYHRQLGEAAEGKYLAGAARLECHRRIARYFAQQPLEREKDGKRSANVRKVSELAFQQTQGEMWDDLEQTLCDLRFIEAKCAVGMSYELIGDYKTALDELPEAREGSQPGRASVAQYVAELIANANASYDLRQGNRLATRTEGEATGASIVRPTAPQSVRPCSEDEIEERVGRITRAPSRLERIRSFYQFVYSQGDVLTEFSSYRGFCVQQAYNCAGSGPVAKAAEALLSATDMGSWLRSVSARPPFNPRPIIERTIGRSGQETIAAMAVTPDVSKAVIASKYGPLEVWDLKSGELISELTQGVCETPDHWGALEGVETVITNPDGTLAVSGERYASGALETHPRPHFVARVWDLTTAECVRTLVHSDSVEHLSLTPGGRLLVIGGSGQDNNKKDYYALRIWDLYSGQCVAVLRGHTARIHFVYITPDGSRVVSTDDGTGRIWDVATEMCVDSVEGLKKYSSNCLTASPDGDWLYSLHDRRWILSWELSTGRFFRLADVGHHKGAGLSVTPDGHYAAVWSANGQYAAIWGGQLAEREISIWDLRSGRCLRRLLGDEGQAKGLHLTWDCRQAVVALDTDVRVLNLCDGYSASDASQNVPVGLFTKVPAARNARRDRAAAAWRTWLGQSLLIKSAATPDGTWASTTCDGRNIVLAASRLEIGVWSAVDGRALRLLRAPENEFKCTLLAPGGRDLVADNRSAMKIWDLETGSLLAKAIKPHEGPAAIAISPDGRFVMSASGDGYVHESLIQVFSARNLACKEILVGDRPTFTSPAVTPDGHRMLAGDSSGRIWVWATSDWSCLQKFQAHRGRINDILPTADGRMVISAGDDATIRIWSTESWKCLWAFAHTRGIRMLALKHRQVYAEDYVGGILFLTLEGLELGAGITTAVRPWHFGETKQTSHSDSEPIGEPRHGYWDEDIVGVCGWCFHRFALDPGTLELIRQRSSDIANRGSQNTFATLVSSSGLARCAQCGENLSFNPFIVEKEDEPRAIASTANASEWYVITKRDNFGENWHATCRNCEKSQSYDPRWGERPDEVCPNCGYPQQQRGSEVGLIVDDDELRLASLSKRASARRAKRLEPEPERRAFSIPYRRQEIWRHTHIERGDYEAECRKCGYTVYCSGVPSSDYGPAPNTCPRCSYSGVDTVSIQDQLPG